MRVLQIPPGFYPIPSKNRAAAIEEIIFQLCNHLTRNNCDVFLIDIREDIIKREGLLATIKEVPDFFPNRKRSSSFYFHVKTILFAFLCIPKIIRLINNEKIDIIHTHYSYSALSILIIGKLFNIVVDQLRDCYHQL